MKEMVNTICYKTKEPIYFNKGTEYEKSCDTFLFTYAPHDKAKAQERIDELNNTKPNKDKFGNKIDWTIVDYFFLSEQERF